MKILPEYLIKYMPYIEEALEELRLSVLDHAYDLLKCLDIDELSTDDIRHKLELYDIKVENMTDAWLPNGRFYRMYPSIKHHRSRKNNLTAIAQSGGQFEGIWSSNFNQSDKYNFKTIQVLRHYEMQSPMDGYFYISGDTSRNADGSIKSSALQALSTDILMGQALPAGYTYLYVPWPRPHYPDDSAYFYNMHMLDYDRLSYTEDCDTSYKTRNERLGWSIQGHTQYGNLWYNPHNHGTNIYYDEFRKKYRHDMTSSSTLQYFTTEGECKNDIPFTEDGYPASMYYKWNTGENTPYRTPYWFDYHYMNDSTHVENSSGKSVSWPISESISYYTLDEDGIKVPSEPSAATKFESDKPELYSIKSVFPTNCYIHSHNRTSSPERHQLFTPEEQPSLYTISITGTDESRHGIYVEIDTIIHSSDNTASTEEEALEIIHNELRLFAATWTELPIDIEEFIKIIDALYYKTTVTLYERTEDTVEYIKETFGSSLAVITEIKRYATTDSNYYFGSSADNVDEGPYRYDNLSKGILNINEVFHHIKTFKPIWSEESPIFNMMQSSDVLQYNAYNSLYYWTNLKQCENRPQLVTYDFENIQDYESIIKRNEPSVSYETFTSYDRPTIGKLDPIYVLYTRAANNNQGNNASVSVRYPYALYYYGETSSNGYDPVLHYELIYKYRDSEQVDSDVHPAYILGCPDNNRIYVNLNAVTTDGNPIYNYFTCKTLKTHTLWFNTSKTNQELHEFHNYLYATNRQQIEFLPKVMHTAISVKDYPLVASTTVDTLSANSTFEPIAKSAGWIKINNSPEKWIYSKGTNLEADDLYVYSNGSAKLSYDILGLYDENGQPVSCDTVNMQLFINGESGSNKYELVCDAYNIVTSNYLTVDLNNQWKYIDNSSDDTYVKNLLDSPDNYTVLKSFSNHESSNNQQTPSNKRNADMYIYVYAPSRTNIPIKIMGCGERGWDYPVIELYRDGENTYISQSRFNTHGTSTSGVVSISTYAAWEDSSIIIPDSGKYKILIRYRKDASLAKGSDCAYIAIENELLSTEVTDYTRVTAASVKFTVSKSDTACSNSTAIALPGEIGDGLWDPTGHELIAKYMTDRDLVYGDEENWWLPRQEYLHRGYVFHQDRLDLHTITEEAGHGISEAVKINLGIIN